MALTTNLAEYNLKVGDQTVKIAYRQDDINDRGTGGFLLLNHENIDNAALDKAMVNDPRLSQWMEKTVGERLKLTDGNADDRIQRSDIKATLETLSARGMRCGNPQDTLDALGQKAFWAEVDRTSYSRPGGRQGQRENREFAALREESLRTCEQQIQSAKMASLTAIMPQQRAQADTTPSPQRQNGGQATPHSETQVAAEDVQAAEAAEVSTTATATAVRRSGITPHNEVAEVQSLLKLSGTEAGPVDGVDGTRTQNGMTAYANKLSAENIHITERSPQGIRAHLMSRMTGTTPEDIAFQIQVHQNAIDAIASGDPDKIKAAQTFFNVKGYTDGQGQSLKIDGVVGSRTNAALEKAQAELDRLKGLEAGPAADAPAAETTDAEPAPEVAATPAGPNYSGIQWGVRDPNGGWAVRPTDGVQYKATEESDRQWAVGKTQQELDTGFIDMGSREQIYLVKQVNGEMIRRDITELVNAHGVDKLGLQNVPVNLEDSSQYRKKFGIAFDDLSRLEGFDESTGFITDLKAERAGHVASNTVRVFQGADGQMQIRLVGSENPELTARARAQTPDFFENGRGSHWDKIDRPGDMLMEMRKRNPEFQIPQGAGVSADPATAAASSQTAFSAAADPASTAAPAAPQTDNASAALARGPSESGYLREHYDTARRHDGPHSLERRPNFGNPLSAGMHSLMAGPQAILQGGADIGRSGPGLVGGLLVREFADAHDNNRDRGPGYRTLEYDAARDGQPGQTAVQTLEYNHTANETGPTTIPLGTGPGRIA